MFSQEPKVDAVTLPSPDFAAIAREHTEALYARALLLTRLSSDAWDLVQSTFEKALRASPACASSAEMRRWLLTVMRNAFIDKCRARQAFPHVSLSDELAGTIPAPAHDSGKPPLWQTISVLDVKQLAQRLSPPMRSTLACAIEGLPIAEIARRLQIPVPTVCTRLFRSRRQLRRMLEGGAETEAAGA